MKTERLTTAESLALDVIRVSASALVAFGHLTQPFFSTGWPDLTSLARDSVAMFFVLSGFVIRHVTCGRRGSLDTYLSDRASRIYSVALPALLLTFFTDSIVRHFNPGFYVPWNPTYARPVGRIITNLIFCGQVWNHSVVPLSNSPYWSVNYEVAYYLIYGCAFFLSGIKRVVWIAILCLFFGPEIVCLMTLWLAGCVAHDFYQRWNAAGTAAKNLDRLLLLCGTTLILCFLPPIRTHLGPPLAHLRDTLNSSTFGGRLGAINYIFGFFWTLAFMRILLWSRHLNIQSGTTFVRTVRFISEGTFPLYLLHFPLYILIAGTIPYDHARPLPKIMIFVAVFLIGVMAGHPGNIFKNKLRSVFASLHFIGQPKETPAAETISHD